jgi:hypothetical protein
VDWIFKHFQLVLALAGGVAWLFKQIKGAQSGGAESPRPHAEKSFEDPELAERTRRIREEIQRKIEQRAKGYATERPQPARTEPATPPVVVTAAELPSVRPSASRQEAQRAAEILEQQRALMEKLQEASLMKVAAEKRTEFEAATADHVPAALTQARSDILEDLHTPEALRRAFILRELLGPPVALRG